MSARNDKYVSGETICWLRERGGTTHRCGLAVTQSDLGRFADQARDAQRRGTAIRGDRVVPPMAVTAARIALFFDVRDLTAGGDFAISADHASAAQGSEAKKPNETHHALRTKHRAIRMPISCIGCASVCTTHIGTSSRANSALSIAIVAYFLNRLLQNFGVRACERPSRAGFEVGSSVRALAKKLYPRVSVVLDGSDRRKPRVLEADIEPADSGKERYESRAAAHARAPASRIALMRVRSWGDTVWRHKTRRRRSSTKPRPPCVNL